MTGHTLASTLARRHHFYLHGVAKEVVFVFVSSFHIQLKLINKFPGMGVLWIPAPCTWGAVSGSWAQFKNKNGWNALNNSSITAFLDCPTFPLFILYLSSRPPRHHRFLTSFQFASPETPKSLYKNIHFTNKFQSYRRDRLQVIFVWFYYPSSKFLSALYTSPGVRKHNHILKRL